MKVFDSLINIILIKMSLIPYDILEIIGAYLNPETLIDFVQVYPDLKWYMLSFHRYGHYKFGENKYLKTLDIEMLRTWLSSYKVILCVKPLGAQKSYVYGNDYTNTENVSDKKLLNIEGIMSAYANIDTVPKQLHLMTHLKTINLKGNRMSMIGFKEICTFINLTQLENRRFPGESSIR